MILGMFLLLSVLALPYLLLPKPKQPNKNIPYAYLLVLGCPTHADHTVTVAQRKRINAAAYYSPHFHIHTIIISGGTVKNSDCEADFIAALLAKDCPDALIKKEPHARNTFQNMQFTKQQYPAKQVLIVTSDAHLRRAAFFARKFYQEAQLGSAGQRDPLSAYGKEYFHMWNTLYWELKLWLRKRMNTYKS